VSSILFPWFSMLWRVDFWQQHRWHLKIWNRMFSCKFYVLNPIIQSDWALFVGDYHKKRFIAKVFPLYLYVFISYLWSFKSNMNGIETWNMLCFHIVFIFWIQICKVIHFNVNACISEHKEIVSFILFSCCSVFFWKFLVTCKSNRGWTSEIWNTLFCTNLMCLFFYTKWFGFFDFITFNSQERSVLHSVSWFSMLAKTTFYFGICNLEQMCFLLL